MLNIYLAMLDTDEGKSVLEKLYNEYKGLMLKVAYDILGDYDLANDALHTAFLKIVNHLQKINTFSCPKTKAYLVIVIENVAKDMYNTRKKQAYVQIEKLEYELPAEINLEENAWKKIQIEKLLEKIKLLPEIYSEVLTLSYVQDLSIKQIAKILDIQDATARKRLDRAKTKLVQLITQEEKESFI